MRKLLNTALEKHKLYNALHAQFIHRNRIVVNIKNKEWAMLHCSVGFLLVATFYYNYNWPQPRDIWTRTRLPPPLSSPPLGTILHHRQ